MEGFCFRNPSFKRIRWGLHGQDHSGDLSIEPHGELGDCRELVFELHLCGEVLEVIDILLESIVRGSILVFSWLLDEFGQVSSCLYFGVKGVEILIVIFDKFCKGLILRFKHGIFQLVIPFL